MAFQRKLLYKVYDDTDVYITTLTDVISDLSITKQINGGDSNFSFVLARKMDDFNEGTEIDFNHRIKVYLQDEYNTAGTTLVAYGYITSYQPYLKGKEEGVEVNCLSAISKLSNDFYRSGTAAAASDLGVELTTKRVDEMMTAIITHYRSTEANSMIGAPSGLTATTDNAGAPFTFDLRFFNMKHIDALREAAKYLAKYKEGGYWYYWRINTAGSLEVKNVSTTATHKFTIGKHITDISGLKSIEGLVNRVYFWNEKGTVDPDYLKTTTDDSTSQNAYDIISEYISDSKITNPTAAGLLTQSKVYDKKDPKVKIQVTLNGEYDLASIKPGETCQIFNVKNNPYKVGADEVLIIQSVTYNVDSAVLELSEPSDDFENIVEEERQRLDKELTWFGYITQQLTAAQLGPANRSWTSDIDFTVSADADAYRKVDWATGIVYIPTSAGNTAGKRVIDAGTTGNMSAATDYYVYLDEETINTSASNSDSGTGIVKQGGNVLGDSGKSWSNDQYKGYIVTIGGQTKIIKSNTATVLTIEDRWTIADTTGAYTIKKMTFDVTTDKESAAKNTSVVFSNVRANTETSSDAIITSTGSGTSSTTNYLLDGYSNIAKESITAYNIKANTITTNELNFTPVADDNVIASINASTEGGGTLRIAANKVQISGDVTFTAGWASVANAEADINVLNTSNAPAQAGADATASNPQDYSWVTGTKPPSNADHTADIVGAMAYEDLVTLAKLDSTIISGGYIKTNLVLADNIAAGTMTGSTIQTSFSGQRVIIDGSNNSLKFYNPAGGLSASLVGYTAAGIFGTGVMISGDIRAEVDDLYINNVFAYSGITTTGNITVSGSVDGVDISSHAASASAHHSRYTDSEARSGVTGTSLPGNLVLGNHEVNDISYIKFDSSYGKIYHGSTEILDFYSTYLSSKKEIRMNSNNVTGINTLGFNATTSSPSTAGQIRYYSSGGIYQFRGNAGGWTGSFDMTAV